MVDENKTPETPEELASATDVSTGDTAELPAEAPTEEPEEGED